MKPAMTYEHNDERATLAGKTGQLPMRLAQRAHEHGDWSMVTE
jgi:hypothetical protein